MTDEKEFCIDLTPCILNDYELDVYEKDSTELIISSEFSINYSVIDSAKILFERIGYKILEITESPCKYGQAYLVKAIQNHE